MAGTSDTSRSPSRMIEPLPNFFSMLRSAASTALPRSAPILLSAIVPITLSRPLSHAFKVVSYPKTRRVYHKWRENGTAFHTCNKDFFTQAGVR